MPKYELENIHRYIVSILEIETLSDSEKVKILLEVSKQMLDKGDK